VEIHREYNTHTQNTSINRITEEISQSTKILLSNLKPIQNCEFNNEILKADHNCPPPSFGGTPIDGGGAGE
jgi:hypothetical protein